jgi:hypothetical protein
MPMESLMRRALVSSVLSCALALGSISVSTTSAHAGWFKSDREALTCDDEKVLNRITSKFRTQAREVHHDKMLAIESYDDVHQHRYLEEREFRPIARRYCGAVVNLNDGRRRTIWYLVERGVGFASVGDNVEFCISGFDRWNVYNNGCRVLR